tara:strand:- start:19 stop:204 length:186 start_codon:yes stop_codon:yes gene_type:complete
VHPPLLLLAFTVEPDHAFDPGPKGVVLKVWRFVEFIVGNNWRGEVRGMEVVFALEPGFRES